MKFSHYNYTVSAAVVAFLFVIPIHMSLAQVDYNSQTGNFTSTKTGGSKTTVTTINFDNGTMSHYSYDDKNGFGGSYAGPAPCTSQSAQLVIQPQTIRFFATGAAATLNALGNPTATPKDQLQPGVTYEIKARVKNEGCANTTKKNFYLDEPPFGTGGSFPMSLKLDFNQDGSNEYEEYINAVGPLAKKGGGTPTLKSQEVVLFPAVTMTDIGVHRLFINADSLASTDPGHSCSGDSGCVVEFKKPGVASAPTTTAQLKNKTKAETNEETITFTVLGGPSLSLGSFLYDNSVKASTGISPVTDISTQPTRDVGTLPANQQTGIFWDGTDIQFATCNGTVTASDGSSPNDFNATIDLVGTSGWVRMNFPAPDDQIDANLTLPATNEYHTYTISCLSSTGAVLTDTITITNGAALTNLVALTPDIGALSVSTDQTLTQLPFVTQNDGPTTVTTYTYDITIAGVSVGGGVRTTNLLSTDSETVAGAISYTTPATPTTLPITICLTHPDMPGQACDSGTLYVTAPACTDGIDNDGDGYTDATDPGCHTDGDATDDPGDADCTNPGVCTYDPTDTDEGDNDPTGVSVSANPTIIRQGGEVTLDYDTGGYGNCTLSPNSLFSPNVVSGVGSLTLTITRLTTITITCGAVTDAVEVRIVPDIFET